MTLITEEIEGDIPLTAYYMKGILSFINFTRLNRCIGGHLKEFKWGAYTKMVDTLVLEIIIVLGDGKVGMSVFM